MYGVRVCVSVKQGEGWSRASGTAGPGAQASGAGPEPKSVVLNDWRAARKAARARRTARQPWAPPVPKLRAKCTAPRDIHPMTSLTRPALLAVLAQVTCTPQLATTLTILPSPPLPFRIIHLALLLPVQLVPHEHRDEVRRRQGAAVVQPPVEVCKGRAAGRESERERGARRMCPLTM
jgi:hypothetical protein